MALFRSLLSTTERPRYLAFITVITLLYLIVELAFNARLLDVVGGAPTAEEVDSIEKFGRFISGAALAIGVWGILVLPRSNSRQWPVVKTLSWLAVSGIAGILIAYFGEKYLIDRIVGASSAQQRYVAVNVKMLSQALVTGNVEIDRISLTTEQFKSPEGKSFLALFPFLTFAIEAVDQKIGTSKPAMVRNLVEHNMGGLHVAYNRYVDSNTEIKRLYNNEYLKGTEQYLAALRRIPEHQEKAWGDYERELKKKRRHMTPERVPRVYWGGVRDEVRSSGVMVPHDWRPSDRQTFYRAVAQQVTKEAGTQYAGQIRSRMNGEYIKPNLTFAEFASSPAVQKQWRESLHLPAGMTLRPDIATPANFSSEVYEPILRSMVREQLVKYNALDEEFADGRRLSQFGKDGMRSVVVPPIALAFSILGALVHIFKLGNYLIFMVSGRRNLGRITMSMVILAFYWHVSATSNAVVTQPLYPTLHRQAAEHFSPLAAGMAKLTIQAQPFAYPVNEWVRLKVLSGATFGYHEGVRD